MEKEKKRIVSVTLKGAMAEFANHLEETYGTKMPEYFRGLLHEKMEEEKSNERPQIIYYGTPPPSGNITNDIQFPIPANEPMPSIQVRERIYTNTTISASNEAMKRIIEETGGNPRLILKKVPLSERRVCTGNIQKPKKL